MHTLKNDQYVPLFFFVLPNKEMETYIIASQLLVQKALNMQYTTDPKVVVVNLEIDLYQAANYWL